MKLAWMTVFMVVAIGDFCFSEIVALRDDAPVFAVENTSGTSNPPTAFELAITNGAIKFDNWTDLLECLNNKQAVRDKISDLKPSDRRKKAAELATLELENERRVENKSQIKKGK